MSTMIASTTTTPDDGAASGSARASLLRAELHRFRSRRFIRVLLLLAVLGWLAATVIALTQFGEPTASDRADARAQVQQIVAENESFRQKCLSDSSVPQDSCPPQLQASDLNANDFLSKQPFDFAATGQGGALGFGAAVAVLAFLVGATWIGAEWSTRSLVALLFWVPRRVKVMGVKVAVLTLAAALLGVLAQAAWLGMAGLLRAVVGTDKALPAHFWSGLLATQGRSVLLTVLAALAGFGLANLVRNTGAALGIGFVYFAVLETAVRILRPAWEPWLLSNNAVALINPHGLRVFIYDGGSVGPQGFTEAREYVISNLQAGIVLAAVIAVVVAIGVVLFARRDLH